MNFDNYLFRAHSIGNMMAGVPKPLTESQKQTLDAYMERNSGIGKPLTEKQLGTLGDLIARKNAKPKLTDGAKTFLSKLVWEELTGRREEIKSKYLDKGLMCEEKSLTLYSAFKDSLVLKNKERKNNDFFTGECDITRYKVRDIKSSWSYKTFPLNSTKIPSKIYEWQLDVYMDLFSYKRAELIYCLVDTPFKLIDDELRRLDWQLNIMDGNGNVRTQHIDLVIEVISGLLFTYKGIEDYCQQSTAVNIEWFAEKFVELPEEMRVKIFKHNYCEKRNKQMKDMVVLARQFMNGVLEGIGEDAIKFHKIKLQSA